MRYVYYWIGFSLLIGILGLFHQKLWKYIWYKWIIESIKYPYVKYTIDKKFKYMLDQDKIKFYTDLAISDRWFKKYWFWRRLEKYILLKHISKIVE